LRITYRHRRRQVHRGRDQGRDAAVHRFGPLGFRHHRNLLVLIGFALLLISHRSSRTAAIFSRVRPGSTG
jgi:hypothetical protein